jgi:quercetin dioxygenase-like cupin family protein
LTHVNDNRLPALHTDLARDLEVSMTDTDARPGALPPSEILTLTETVAVAEGAIVSRTLMRTEGGSLTAFAFDRGEALSEHSAPCDALVQLLDGRLVVTIAGDDSELHPGQAILMPADVPHAVRAPSPAKWLLVMLKTRKQ